jgi:hypothetical protein
MILGTDQTRLTQIAFLAHSEATASYCRFYNGADWTNLDSNMLMLDGSNFPLWTDSNDVFYVGAAAVFAFVGFGCKTAGVGYGTFRFQYSALGGPYNIVEVSQVNKTFKVATDLTSKFTANSQFEIHGSTGNDGGYTCGIDATYSAPNTTITVLETINSSVADGHVEQDSIWTKITAVHNSTAGFTQSGYIGWVIASDWTLRTVNGKSAYWIRTSQSAVAPTTVAVAYNLLRSVILYAPLHMLTGRTTPAIGRDINGDTFKRDIPQRGADRLVIEGTQIAFGSLPSMPQAHAVWDWWHYSTRLYIESGAHTVPIGTTAFSTDAYAHAFKGRIITLPPGLSTPNAMDIPDRFQIEIEVDEIETLTGRLGVTV